MPFSQIRTFAPDFFTFSTIDLIVFSPRQGTSALSGVPDLDLRFNLGLLDLEC